MGSSMFGWFVDERLLTPPTIKPPGRGNVDKTEKKGGSTLWELQGNEFRDLRGGRGKVGGKK